jgi:hypothetical protein
MIKICRTSGQPFEITEDDLRFYEKMGVPPPTLCPEERMRRRLAWRNERKLYHRVCDGSGKKIISMYSPDKPFPVYENDYWWSDNLSGQQYKRDYDFRRSLFEQFKELLDVTPKMARIQQGENENSTYCNTASWNKNCYLLQAADQSEDCFMEIGYIVVQIAPIVLMLWIRSCVTRCYIMILVIIVVFVRIVITVLISGFVKIVLGAIIVSDV